MWRWLGHNILLVTISYFLCKDYVFLETIWMFEIEWESYLSFWLIQNCPKMIWIGYSCWDIDIVARLWMLKANVS